MTLLVMLGLLIGPYLLLSRVAVLRPRGALRGCLGIALLFTFTGVGHFLMPEKLVPMIPPPMPARVEIIYLTGVIEIAAAWMVLPRRTRRITGWLLILMLVGLLPFNIYAALERVPVGGHELGAKYLFIRIPLQVVIVVWCYWFAVRPGQTTGQEPPASHSPSR